MRNLLSSFLLLCFIFCSSVLHAQYTGQTFNITVSSGYQVENSSWSIAGNTAGTNPNVYSELKWKKLQSVLVQAHASWRFYKAFRIGVDVSRAYTQSGKVTDTDYGQDNRQDPVYHGVFKDDKGNTSMVHAVLSYTFVHPHYTITPSLGYVYNRQALYVLPSDANTPADLHSTYTATWKGAVAGVSASLMANRRIILIPAFDYYQLQYDAKANWNLITQFQHPVSFTHTANGYALAPSLRVQYTCNAHTKIFIKGNYTYWNTGHGTDVLYLNSGETDHTQLNAAKRDGMALTAGISYGW